MTKKRERALDRALGGDRPTDPEITALVEAADQVDRSLAVDVPDAERERAIFVAGIRGAKRAFPFLRLFAPAVAVAGLLLIAILGRGAVPGDALYPVRRALHSVGLAPSPLREINMRIDAAKTLLDEAEIASRAEAERQTLDAITDLGRARDLLPEIGADVRGEMLAEIAALERRAIAILVDLDEGRPAPFGDDDDNSGPGGGEDDSSGPGGGDEDGEDGDNSGPGGDEDDVDDDSSGPGSGDSDGDSSGPESGDSDDDSSRSGSGDSDDSSGPGSD
ncbi:MAG: hypothetical protein ACRDJJ_01690 [Actinomycetota bacterium]